MNTSETAGVEIKREALQIEERIKSFVRFCVTEEMVNTFGELTGDRSPLHTSGAFARRSAYRRPVVHGMLPVAFVAILDVFHQEGFHGLPVELSGQFVAPVFAGDELCLRGEVLSVDPERGLATCAYAAESVNSGTTVLKGTIKVRYVKAAPGNFSGRPSKTRDAVCLPTEPMELRALTLDQISVKDSDCFQFTISDEALRVFLKILSASSVIRPFDPGVRGEGIALRPFLALMLLSTSVGMCIPGTYATFLAFDAKIEGEIENDCPYRLRGEVTHVSASTRMIKKDVVITKGPEERSPIATARVSVLVNEPPAKMPTVLELKKMALDTGLQERVVLITGASRGIGETMAKLFALHGAKVVVNYFRGREDADRIASEIREQNGEAFACKADVRDAAQVREMVQATAARYGTVDVLVNNAVRDFKPADFLKLCWEDIQADIDVVLKGAFNCCKEVIPLMLNRGSGKIINIGTVATENPPPNQLKYVIAKSGLLGLTRSLSRDFAARNIHVNMVVPNFVETDLVSHIPAPYRKKIAQDTPMQRNASPVDIAQAVVFLASSHSSFTTGQKILVTGGGAPYL